MVERKCRLKPYVKKKTCKVLLQSFAKIVFKFEYDFAFPQYYKQQFKNAKHFSLTAYCDLILTQNAA